MDISEKIWHKYHARLKAFIQARISDAAAADDVLQNVFLKMHGGLPSLQDRTKLQSWLYQIARNVISDYYRSVQPTVAVKEFLPDSGTDPNEKTTRELSECLRPMIEQLPDTYREAIILSEIKELTQKEVSRVQGISASGAKSRVQRGRALLKEMLTECCRLEFDHQGRLCDYERKDGNCKTC